jgi:GT2 family glycosyltransferase
MTPTVSVIIPVYNAAATLRATVASVRAQTLRDWELILVDDGSTDLSFSVATALTRKDPRIRRIAQANAGPSAARNAGARIARGRYLAFLDADDHWAPKRLEGLAGFLDAKPDAGVAFSRVAFLDERTGRITTRTRHYPSLPLERLLPENPTCSSSNIFIRAEAFAQIGGFDTGLRFAEDQDLLVRLAAVTDWRILGVDKGWLTYRCGDESQSSDLDAMEEGWQRLMSHVSDLAPEKLRGRHRGIEAAFYRAHARRALRAGGSAGAAVGALARSFLTDPTLVFRSPRRSLLTLAGVLLALTPFPKLKEYVR